MEPETETAGLGRLANQTRRVPVVFQRTTLPLLRLPYRVTGHRMMGEKVEEEVRRAAIVIGATSKGRVD